MKDTLRKVFSPLLKPFESGETDYIYRESHRSILKFVGLLFLFLAFVSLYAAVKASALGGAIPATVFLVIGLVCEIVAFLGSDRAVANIWKRR